MEVPGFLGMPNSKRTSKQASKQAYLHMWVRNTNMRLTQALLIIIDESDDSDVDVSLQDDHAIPLQWLNGIAKK